MMFETLEINKIIRAIHEHHIRISDHANEESIIDNLTLDEIVYSVIHGEIIEHYPKDKPYPSCLIFGFTDDGKPVHSVWAYNSQNEWAVLITVYLPNIELWIDFKTRRKK